jgi:hypothetical protein
MTERVRLHENLGEPRWECRCLLIVLRQRRTMGKSEQEQPRALSLLAMFITRFTLKPNLHVGVSADPSWSANVDAADQLRGVPPIGGPPVRSVWSSQI